MTRVFLSLGSNLGDRMGYLRSAIAALGRAPHSELRGVSAVYETAPVEVEAAAGVPELRGRVGV